MRPQARSRDLPLTTTTITTGQRTFTKQTVDDLTVYVDTPDSPPRATILVAPPFGISADNLFLPAYILAANGFRVIRFDPTNHVGESPGAIWDFLLSTFAADTRRMLEWATPEIVLGFSLAAPPILRALGETGSQAHAVLAAPVVNVRYTLNEVLGIDYYTPENADMPQAIVVLGEKIDGRLFRADTLDFRMHSHEEAIADALKAAGTVSLIAGSEDPWVSLDEVRELVRRRDEELGEGRTRLQTVSVGTHQFNLNPAVANTYMTAVLVECLHLSGADESEGRVPPLHEAISDRQGILEQLGVSRPRRNK